MHIVTLTSDLGTTDFYVGAVKGAILTAAPQVQIIDISHNIPSHDIVQGAFMLKNTFPNFPAGSLHFISINNNYNHHRTYVLFSKDGHYFCGPNNGLFSLMFDRMPEEVFEINAPPGGTLVIRQIFAKVARQLAKGDTLNEIGDPVQNLVVRMALHPVVTKTNIRGSVIHVDKYDNVILNITRELFERAAKGREFALFFKRFDPITTISESYHDVPVGEVLCKFNAANHLELAINMGKASSLLGLKVEETIQIDFYDPGV